MKFCLRSSQQVLRQLAQTIILVALVTILGKGSETLWAGINVWTSSGLAGETVQALAVDPQNSNTIYAGTLSSGVFKSMDRGESWSAVNSGLTTSAIGALAIDPQNPSTVYAGSFRGGVFKTMDGGASWSAVNSGLTNAVGALAIDPQNPSTIYAGSFFGGVFKSTNGGTSWVWSGLAGVNALAIDPRNPSTIYAGIGDVEFHYTGGVFKSTDGATSWTAVDTGLPNPFSMEVHALAIDPQNPSTLYAGIWPGALFKSTDGGMSWSVANSGLVADFVGALAIDPQNPATVYAGSWYDGVFKSTNGAKNWVWSGPATTVNVLAIDPQNPSRVYAGTVRSGVFEITFASPVLTLDSTKYCIGASWNLKVSNAASSASIRLLGTSKGQSWEIAEWGKTDANGSFSASGTFPEGTEGNYALRVEIGGLFSNTVSFAVSNCKP